MAVTSSSNAALDLNTSHNDTKQITTNPGVRGIDGKIDVSDGGKSCHQCRQKTRSFAAACKNQRNSKPCTLLFCHRCLLNRYGEKAEEVEVLEEWSCPKCRGICNCSCCRKKQGQQPTGILSHRAKAIGYSSVSALLHANGLNENMKHAGASPKKQTASDKEIASPRNEGKENIFNGRIDMNLDISSPNVSVSSNSKSKELVKMQGGTLENQILPNSSPYPDNIPKKIKEGTSKAVHACQKDAAALEGCSSGVPIKSGVLNVSNQNDVKPNEKIDDLRVEDGCLTIFSTQVLVDSFKNKKRNADEKIEEPDNKKATKRVKHDSVHSIKDNINGCQSQNLGADIPLPLGTELLNIGNVELPPKDIGSALQFLEFCAAFGKTLNMKKEQSIVILQEIMNGQTRTRRSEQHSPLVHFHIRLLSLLQKESDSRPQRLSLSNGKNSWLLALKNCLSKSTIAIDSLTVDCLDSEAAGYNTLDSSTKLRILNFLCDEVLETERIRDWINDQELKFAQKARQAKEKVLAAKDKEKSLKQKLINELAKATNEKDGASVVSISEHDEIVCRIKCEAAQAHKETLESMNMVPKATERSQAVRTRPIFLDVDGRAFWRLNGYSKESNILVQDIGIGDDSIVFGEKWITFDDVQEKVVQKHISFRERMGRARPVAEVLPSQTNA